MPFGTASARLKRKILWSLLAELNRVDCSRCNEPMTEATFSVDHIVDWQDNSVGLFWDIGNISWSHLSCNVGAARRSTKPVSKITRARVSDSLRTTYENRREVAPKGLSWCSTHQEFLKESAFHSSKYRWSNRSKQCISCRSKASPLVHGTESAYNVGRCRCSDCRSAAREARTNRNRRARSSEDRALVS